MISWNAVTKHVFRMKLFYFTIHQISNVYTTSPFFASALYIYPVEKCQITQETELVLTSNEIEGRCLLNGFKLPEIRAWIRLPLSMAQNPLLLNLFLKLPPKLSRKVVFSLTFVRKVRNPRLSQSFCRNVAPLERS